MQRQLKDETAGRAGCAVQGKTATQVSGQPLGHVLLARCQGIGRGHGQHQRAQQFFLRRGQSLLAWVQGAAAGGKPPALGQQVSAREVAPQPLGHRGTAQPGPFQLQTQHAQDAPGDPGQCTAVGRRRGRGGLVTFQRVQVGVAQGMPETERGLPELALHQLAHAGRLQVVGHQAELVVAGHAVQQVDDFQSVRERQPVQPNQVLQPVGDPGQHRLWVGTGQGLDERPHLVHVGQRWHRCGRHQAWPVGVLGSRDPVLGRDGHAPL